MPEPHNLARSDLMVRDVPLGSQASVAIGLLGLIPVGIGLLFFTSSGRDDAHITYWAAHALANHAEIVNYNGQRLEQSSSLLHVLLLAAFSKITPFSLPAISRILSMGCAVALAPMSYMLAEDADPGRGLAAAWLTATTVAYWSVSGMETTLAAASAVAMVLMVSRLIRAPWRVGAFIGGLCAMGAYLLARPESILVLTCALLIMLGTLLVRQLFAIEDAAGFVKHYTRRVFVVLILVFMLTGLLMGFRRTYFGEWFPHPVLAKSDGPVIAGGLKYFVQVALDSCESAFWLLGAVGSVVLVYFGLSRGTFQRTRVFVASYLLAQLAFTVASGGDWMEGGRFLVAAVPFAAVVTVVVLGHLVQPPYYRAVLAGLVALQILASAQICRFHSIGQPLWAGVPFDGTKEPFRAFSWWEAANRENRRDMPVVSHLIQWVARTHDHTREPVTVMGQNMGLIAYYVSLSEFGRVHFLDMHALTTADFLQCPTTANRPRSPSGLALSYERYFDLAPEIQKRCDRGNPDIIFDCISTFLNPRPLAVRPEELRSVPLFTRR